MHLTADDVLRLARQARFVLLPEELERFRVQLNAVLQEIGILEELSEEALAAPDSVAGVRLRADDSRPDELALPLDSFNAELVARFFTVPRVIGGSRAP